MLNEMGQPPGQSRFSSGKSTIFIFLLLICSLLSGICSAQSQFQRTIGGTTGDYAFSIIQTTDGGYAVAGSTQSFGAGSWDMYIVKLDASGTLQWTRTVGGTAFELANSIIQTTDGGYAVAGYTLSFGAGSRDIYILKLDESGTLQWSKTVGGTGFDIAYSIIQTLDGGYAVAGYTDSFGAGQDDFYIVKLDASGTLQWSKTVGGTNYDEASSIIQTTDGGYAVAGTTDSFGAGIGDMYIVKLDASGTLQWSRTIGGTHWDFARSIIQTTDGGYAATGNTYSIGAGIYPDMYIVKLDASGTLQWSRSVGGIDAEIAWSIIQTTDGGYAAAGYTQSFGGNDMYIVKLDGSGTLQWSRTVGGTYYDEAFSIIQTTDGGYAAAGVTESFGAGKRNMYIVKLDASGNTCANSTSPTSISGTVGTTTSPTSTVNTPPSTVTAPPSTTNTGGTVTTICTTVGIQPISNEIPETFRLEQNYPNPFNPATKIRFSLPRNLVGQTFLSVYDILGREVAVLINELLNPGTYEMVWDASKFSSGVYYYKIVAGDYTDTKKMILIK